MNQTAWIVGGGILLVAVAFFLYMTGGSSVPSSPQVKIEDKTLIVDNQITVPPLSNASQDVASTPQSEEVILHTSMGDITLHLHPNDAPKTVENFIKLSREGFYNDVKFHRVIKGFMNQTGDPLSKDDSKIELWGQGGPGYKFADEINAQSAIYQKGYKFGVVAMANAGPNTNGSQFFIMATDYPLPPAYTIFGEVTSGLDVVKKINEVKTDSNDRPLEPIAINAVEVK